MEEEEDPEERQETERDILNTNVSSRSETKTEDVGVTIDVEKTPIVISEKPAPRSQHPRKDENQIEAVVPHVTLGQATALAKETHLRIDTSTLPTEGQDTTWLTFEQYLLLMRPDLQDLKKMHLNEIKTSFEEWDRRGASELKLSEFDQLTRSFGIVTNKEDIEALGSTQVSFEMFLRWLEKRLNGNLLEFPLPSLRRYFNAYKLRYGYVSTDHARELSEHTNFPLVVRDEEVLRITDEGFLTFSEFASLFIEKINEKYNMVMLNELKDIFELADEDHTLALDRDEFEKNVGPILGLKNNAMQNVNYVQNTLNFTEFCQWFSSQQPHDQLPLNVFFKHFLANSNDGVFVPYLYITQLVHHFGNTPIPPHFEDQDKFTFDEFLQIVAPNLSPNLAIAPFNELAVAFTSASVGVETSNTVQAVPWEQMTNLSGAYGMVGSVLNELRGELVTFQLFVEWYCKELDLRHYKDEYDRANPETPEKMPKATFKEILTQMDIKLTPEERNEVFANNVITIDEYAKVLKSRGFEYMILPTDKKDMYKFKVGKLPFNIFTTRFNDIASNQQAWSLPPAEAELFSAIFCSPLPPKHPYPDFTFAELLSNILSPDHELQNYSLNELKAGVAEYDVMALGVMGGEEAEGMGVYYGKHGVGAEGGGSVRRILMRMFEIGCGPLLSGVGWNVLIKRFTQRSPNAAGRIPISQTLDLSRYFGYPVFQSQDQEQTFSDFAAHALDDGDIDPMMNDFRTVFNEFAMKTPPPSEVHGDLGALVTPEDSDEICAYLGVNAGPFADEKGVTASVLWEWYESNKGKNTLCFNALKRRFDEFDTRKRGTLTATTMHDFARHFDSRFDELNALEPPFTFHEAVECVYGPERIGKVRLNDLKKTFDENRRPTPTTWVTTAYELSQVRKYYCIQQPLPDPATFHKFFDWFVEHSSGDNLDCMNVIHRRFDEFDTERKGHISIDDMKELCRFFHRSFENRPPLPESVEDGTVLFHEAVMTLIEQDSPIHQSPAALNELLLRFEECEPENHFIPFSKILDLGEYYDTIVPTNPEPYWISPDRLSLHEFYRWYIEKEVTRPRIHPLLRSLNVLQRRFNDFVDPNEMFLTYAKITHESAVALCRFLSLQLETTILAIPRQDDGYILFLEFVRMIIEGGSNHPVFHLSLNDIKLVFETCDRDNNGKLSLYEFEEAAHVLDIKLRSFTDAKLAGNGMTFSAFVAWILEQHPDIFPDIQITYRRSYNNFVPNFNSLRRRFNEMDEMTDVLTIPKAQFLFRFFDLDTRGIAEARSLHQQELDGVDEEKREPYQFEDEPEAFEYLLPPPFKDEDGVEHEIDELSFQHFCHMTIYPNDMYFECESLNELKNLFEAMEESLGGEGGVITEALYNQCTEIFFLTEEEKADLNIVNGLVSFNEFVRQLAFAPKTFVGFALRQTRKKGRDCMTQCVVS